MNSLNNIKTYQELLDKARELPKVESYAKNNMIEVLNNDCLYDIIKIDPGLIYHNLIKRDYLSMCNTLVFPGVGTFIFPNLLGSDITNLTNLLNKMDYSNED